MNKKYGTVIFLGILGVLVLVIAGHNFVRYHIIKNYPLNVFTTCNPANRSCFEVDGDAGLIFQAEPYAKVEITAAYAPSCLGEHSCSDFSCDGLVGVCNITYCSEYTKEEGEICSGENQ